MNNHSKNLQPLFLWAALLVLPIVAIAQPFNPRIIIANETANNEIFITEVDGNLVNWFETVTAGNNINIVASDFDADGETEIAINVSQQVLLYKLDGTNIDAFPVPHEGDIAAGDFDGDGLPEFFASTVNSHTISIFGGNGNLLDTVPIEALDKNARLSITTADINGDGIVEIIAGDLLKEDKVAIYV